MIAVAGRKGGIGKTTITANLAGEYLAKGLKVRVIDLDPQHSMFNWARRAEKNKAILADCVESLEIPEFTDDGDELKASDKRDWFEKQLKKLSKGFDVILIDTPPSVDIPPMVAAATADVIVLPVGASSLDLLAIKDTLDVAKAAQMYRDGLPHICFVPSKIDESTSIAKALPGTLRRFKENIFTPIPQLVALQESPSLGKTVGEYAPASKAAKLVKKLAKEVRGLAQ